MIALALASAVRSALGWLGRNKFRFGWSLYICAVVGFMLFSHHLGTASERRKWELKESAQHVSNLQLLLANSDYNAQLAGDYYLRRAATETRYKTITRKVPDVTTSYVPAAGASAVPIPDCIITAGFVRLWNDALTAGERLPSTAGVAAEPATGADSAPGPPRSGG